jgi:hypothetical protein
MSEKLGPGASVVVVVELVVEELVVVELVVVVVVGSFIAVSTSTGLSPLVVVPSPSWPYTLSPQAQRVPVALRARE